MPLFVPYGMIIFAVIEVTKVILRKKVQVGRAVTDEGSFQSGLSKGRYEGMPSPFHLGRTSSSLVNLRLIF